MVIVAIDNESVTKYGQWPWKRALFVEFIEKMNDLGAKIVAFDLVWSEPEQNAGLDALKRAIKKVGAHSVMPQMTELKHLGHETRNLKEEWQENLDDGFGEDDPDQIELKSRMTAIGNKKKRLKKAIFHRRKALKSEVALADDFFKFFSREKIRSNNDLSLGLTLKDFPNTVLGYSFLVSEEQGGGLKKFKKETQKAIDGSVLTLSLKPNQQSYIDFYVPKAVDGIFNHLVIVNPYIGAGAPTDSEYHPHHGFFNANPDSDAIYRRLELVYNFCPTQSKNEPKRPCSILPSLSLKATSLFLNLKPFVWFDEELGQQFNTKGNQAGNDTELRLVLADEKTFMPEKPKVQKSLNVPLEKGDSGISFRVNFYGEGGTIPTISFKDVMENHPAVPEIVKDKLIFVGPTALAIVDFRQNPFDTMFPGVEIHASAAQNLISKQFLVRDGKLDQIETLGLALLGFILCLICLRTTLLFSTSFLVLMAYVTLQLDVKFFFSQGLLLSTTAFYGLYILIYTWSVNIKYWITDKEKREVKKRFSTYVSPEVAEVMLKKDVNLKGESKVITVFFSDIRGYTALSEGRDTEDLVTQLSEYFDPMTRIIMDEKGTLDKYMGDAIMAFFGAPVDYEDHANCACRSAIKQIDKLNELNKVWPKKDYRPIDIGIGINTGLMHVGNMGSAIRFDYTVMGDEVNLGSRLEGINKQYGTQIILSEATRNQLANGEFLLRFLDIVIVKGKEDATKIYELIGFIRDATEEQKWIVKQYEMALDLYKQKDWENAVKALGEILDKNDDFPAKSLLERVINYQSNGVPDCFPAYKMTSK